MYHLPKNYRGLLGDPQGSLKGVAAPFGLPGLEGVVGVCRLEIVSEFVELVE